MNYLISIINLSIKEKPNIIWYAKNTNEHDFSQDYHFPENSGLAVYSPLNSSQVVTKRETEIRDNFLSEIIGEIDLPDSFWLIVIRIGYTWGAGLMCGGYECTEMIIQGVNLNILGMFVSGGSLLC